MQLSACAGIRAQSLSNNRFLHVDVGVLQTHWIVTVAVESLRVYSGHVAHKYSPTGVNVDQIRDRS